MGKRLSMSHSQVISTELAPLSDNFELDTRNEPLEQWYYENTATFRPDRRIAPLIIYPKVECVDVDTGIKYESSAISYSSITWKRKYWNGTQWVDAAITTGADFEVDSANSRLIVHRNLTDPAHGETITCIAVYNDPRPEAQGITVEVKSSLLLSCSKDARVLYPELNILNENTAIFNPLRDQNPVITYQGVVDWSKVMDDNTTLAEMKCDPLGTESIVPQNDTSMVTCAPYMDIRYGTESKTDQQFMFRKTANGEVSEIERSLGYVNNIKGNTVAWNQSISLLSSVTHPSGLTITSSNGLMHIQGTITQSGGRTTELSYYFSLVNGHKYYIKRPTSPYLVWFIGKRNDGYDYIGVNAFFTSNKQYDGTAYLGVNTTINPGVSIDISEYVYLFDLTLMFGAGNEPTTEEQLKSWLDANVGLKDYYPYDAGSLIPVTMTGIKTVGFNQWDEEWELGAYNIEGGKSNSSTNNFRNVNPIRVFPNTDYYFKSSTSLFLYWYDSAMNLIIGTISVKNAIYTSPQGAVYLNFYAYQRPTYNHDICINISNPTKNGTYEPYWENTTRMDVRNITGVPQGGGQRVRIFPNGLKKAGTVQDEIYLYNGLVMAAKRIGEVNLGTLGWYSASTNTDKYYMVGSTISGLKRPTGDSIAANIVCSRYATQPYTHTYMERTGVSIAAVNTAIRIYDPSYNTSSSYTAFKSAMDGVMLYYELETEEIYTDLQFLDGTPIPQVGQLEWYGLNDEGNEVPIDTLPCYTQTTQPANKGQHTDKININAMYGENITVILRAKRFADDAQPLPPKEYRTLTWKIAPVDSYVVSECGSAVYSTSGDYKFSTIVNIKNEVLSDAVKKAHLAFKWFMTKHGGISDERTFVGYGQNIVLTHNQVSNTRTVAQVVKLSSTDVSNEVYLLGAYEAVMDGNGQPVTDGQGNVVYDRPIE